MSEPRFVPDDALLFPHPALRERYLKAHYKGEGVAQPWVQAALYTIVTGCGFTTVAELGCFRGVTSAWLCWALEQNGGGTFYGNDIDTPVLAEARRFLGTFSLPNVQLHIDREHTERYIAQLPETTDFVFLDDDKIEDTILLKLAALRERLPGKLLAMHDVEHYAPWWAKEGGVVIPMSRIHEFGNLGLMRL